MRKPEPVDSIAALRPGRASDADFVYDSWLNSYRENNGEAKAIPKPLYFSEQRLVIERLLSESLVYVACAADADWQVLAWSVVGTKSAQGCLHYLYVKHLYRGFDLTALLTEPIRNRCRWYSHRTPKMERVAASLGLSFNPYLAGVHS